MDPTDLIKHIPSVAGGLAASDFVKRLLAPTADVLGQKMRERVERFFEKAAQANPELEANFHNIPHRVLVPLIQGVAFEDDERLHDMWSALLANAASHERRGKAKPAFIAILKQLDPQEAGILESLHEDHRIPVTSENEFRRYGRDLVALRGEHLPKTDKVSEKLKSLLELQLSLDGLVAQQLIRQTFWIEQGEVYTEIDRPLSDHDGFTYTLTARGRTFVEACQPSDSATD
jgi:hypothetical protein